MSLNYVWVDDHGTPFREAATWAEWRSLVAETVSFYEQNPSERRSGGDTAIINLTDAYAGGGPHHGHTLLCGVPA